MSTLFKAVRATDLALTVRHVQQNRQARKSGFVLDVDLID